MPTILEKIAEIEAEVMVEKKTSLSYFPLHLLDGPYSTEQGHG